jgi:hypothetical protein
MHYPILVERETFGRYSGLIGFAGVLTAVLLMQATCFLAIQGYRIAKRWLLEKEIPIQVLNWMLLVLYLLLTLLLGQSVPMLVQ